MKKELSIFLILALLLLVNEAHPQSEAILCDGCLIDRACLEIGTQKQESENGPTFYCSTDKKLEKAKETGKNCNYDYECLAYNCESNICTEKLEKETIKNELIIITALITLLVLLIISLIFLIFKLSFRYKKSMKKEKKTRKEENIEKKLNLPKYEYKYKPELDMLEKKLKESLKKPKK